MNTPRNEPVLEYRPGAPETQAIHAELKAVAGREIEIPVIINGKEIRTGAMGDVRVPHRHRHVLARFHKAGTKEVAAAISGALEAKREWEALPSEERNAVFLRAAELLASPRRWILNASTMLGQSKTVFQAEIDSACELIDFYRFNVHFQQQLCEIQPISGPGQRNRLEYRPLEGFIFALTPFNFTSIAGNLPTAPAILGNVSLWKPASTSLLSSYYIYRLLEEAGLPPGVIQFLPGSGPEIGNPILASEHLAGIHFTGSTDTFQNLWATVGKNIARYRGYPRLVGETGGKDFVLVHPSADVPAVVTALLRGAYEFQGQKCSAASRAYLPKSLWGRIKESLVAEMSTVKMGDITDFRNFMGAVIDKPSFDRIKGYIDEVKRDGSAKIIAGGNCDDKEGYFIEPTLIEASVPGYRTMCEEIFGPVLTVYIYDDAKFDETIRLVDSTSPYALTGAVIAQDRDAIERATRALWQSAGNFYINNKPTGAVVGQQPFGGARASGTNDKAGSIFNLIRWTSARTVSETFVPPKDYRYPFMG